MISELVHATPLLVLAAAARLEFGWIMLPAQQGSAGPRMASGLPVCRLDRQVER